MPDPHSHFLALDQGGSASRAIVFDAHGQPLASARIEVAHQRPRPGWVEQDPDAVVESLRQAADEAVSALDAGQRRRLQSAGLVCQRSSLVAWDIDSGSALTPVLSWQDTRGAGWLAAQMLDYEVLHERTGLYPNAHFGLSKIRWLLDHSAPVQRAAVTGRLRIGPLAAFLAFRLLREQPVKVDPANASRTLLLDLDRRDWCDDLLTKFAVERDWLPVVHASDADYGDLSLPAATLPLQLLSGDQSSAAFAFGAPSSHCGYLNVGTGAFVYRTAIAARTPARMLRSVIHWSERPQFAIEGTVNGAGSALAWFADENGLDAAGIDIDREWSADSASDTLFLNGIGGLGSPDWRADFPSRFVGTGNLAQQRIAIVESIAFLLQRNLQRLQEQGDPLRQLLISGGLSRSSGFCQTLASLSGLPLHRPEECEASARGAAFLLAGQPDSWQELPEKLFLPSDNPALAARFHRWTALMDEALGTA